MKRDEQIIVTLDPLFTGWIGCSIFDDREELDLPAQKVSGLISNVVYFHIPSEIPSGTHRATVALWEKKTQKERCKKGYDNGPCYYCLKNGYHLEEEKDRRYFTVKR